MDEALFRSALAQWPSGVAVVTTVGPQGPRGMTASSFSSVSLHPPLVSVCVGDSLPTRAMVARAGAFAVSFLGKDQAHIGQVFAGLRPEVTDRFAGLAWQTAETGCPVLADATAWLDCRVAHAYPGGDHTIFVGEVLAARTPRAAAPLLFHSRNWGQLADPLPERIWVSSLAQTAITHRQVAVSDPGDLARIGERNGVPVLAYVQDAFNPQREQTVLATVQALAALPGVEVGCQESGQASPLQVRRVLQEAVVRLRPGHLRLRLRGHHGLGLVNALVAMKSGVRHFDTVASSNGDGGLLTDDLMHLASQLGVACAGPLVPSKGES